jgi:hypothetical protein
VTWQPVSAWRQLGGVAGPEPDPYLIWAQLTGWAYLLDAPGETSERGGPVLVLLELCGEEMPKFRAAFSDFAEGGPGLLPPVYRGGRFATVWVSRGGLEGLLDPSGPTGCLIRRAEVSLPMRSLRPTPPPLSWPALPTKTAGPPALRAPTVLGVIDNGCPFARRSLCRQGDAGPSTRIAAIWEMHPSTAPASDKLTSTVPACMGYGLERRRSGAGGLDRWLERFADAHGALDEEGCYAEAGRPELRSLASHGAHMLDLLAGPVSLGRRLATDADTPPDWMQTDDPAADPTKTDIVFVQLPASALADSSGAWLGAHVLDAVSYLAEGLRSGAVERVLINLSYGCTTGPHDGSSIVERALDAVVDAHAGKVTIAIAAGNSYASRGHVMLTRKDFDAGTHLSTPIVWRVLPGSETPSFMQLWLPRGSAGSALSLQVATPSGDVHELHAGEVAIWPDVARPLASAIFLERSSRGEDSPMILVALAPTNTSHGDIEPAPHGDWTLQFRAASASSISQNLEVHAFIARNDHDLGMPARGRQSYFVDPHDEPYRYLRGCADDVGMQAGIDESDADRRGAILRRRGTLNGIAGGQKVLACAGYRLSDFSHATYSSAGMSSSGRGKGPASAFVTDESTALRGVRAGGNASGATFRLVGTSTAPPQALRRLAARRSREPQTPEPGDPSNAQDLWGGEGRVKP